MHLLAAAKEAPLTEVDVKVSIVSDRLFFLFEIAFPVLRRFNEAVHSRHGGMFNLSYIVGRENNEC